MKREQRDRQRLKAAKDETERLMAQRERLMLTITHDIKAPAASISGFIQLLDERMRGDAKAASYVQTSVSRPPICSTSSPPCSITIGWRAATWRRIP